MVTAVRLTSTSEGWSHAQKGCQWGLTSLRLFNVLYFNMHWAFSVYRHAYMCLYICSVYVTLVPYFQVILLLLFVVASVLLYYPVFVKRSLESSIINYGFDKRNVTARPLQHVTRLARFYLQTSTTMHPATTVNLPAIYYLKLHKTGSTTMRRILQRKAFKTGARLPLFNYQDIGGMPDMRKNLIAIDSLLEFLQYHKSSNFSDAQYFRFWTKIYRNFTGTSRAVKENQCDLIENHTRFNKSAVKLILNGKQPNFFLATIRDPPSHIKSVANYFGFYKRWNITDPMDRFKVLMDHVTVYDREGQTKNFMAKEFGLRRSYDDNSIDFFLDDLKNNFDIVLRERFDESLLVLRHKYNWTLDDILYMKFYQFKYVEKESVVSDSLRAKVQSWSNVDTELYNMFYQRQLSLEEQRGSTFKDELAVFRSMNKQVKNFCMMLCEEISEGQRLQLKTLGQVIDRISISQLRFQATPYSASFNFDIMDCVIMLLHEKMVNWLLHVRQRPKLCEPGVIDMLARMKVFEPLKLTDMNMFDVELFCDTSRRLKYGIPYNFKIDSIYFAGCYGQGN